LSGDQSGGAHQAGDCRFELSLARICGSGPQDEEHVPARDERGGELPQDRAQPSTLSIADHGRTEAPTGRYAKSSLFKSVPAVAQQQQGVASAAAVGLDGLEGDA